MPDRYLTEPKRGGYWQWRPCRHSVPLFNLPENTLNDFQPSEACVSQVQIFEGYREVPYTDDAGFLTWGYGHKQRPGEPVPHSISPQQASALLAADLSIAGAAVRRHVTVEMTQAQFDGLVDWTFNLGEGRLANSTMLECINAGDWDGACEQCGRWVFAAGKRLEGLARRRKWDAEMMRPVPTGEQPITDPSGVRTDIPPTPPLDPMTPAVVSSVGESMTITEGGVGSEPNMSGGGGDFAGAGASGSFNPDPAPGTPADPPAPDFPAVP